MSAAPMCFRLSFDPRNKVRFFSVGREGGKWTHHLYLTAPINQREIWGRSATSRPQPAGYDKVGEKGKGKRELLFVV